MKNIVFKIVACVLFIAPVSCAEQKENTPQAAGDCLVAPFFEGIDLVKSENETTYIIKGINLGQYEYGLKIGLLEDLKGNFPENDKIFMVWGDGRLSTISERVDILSTYDNRDTLIMQLTGSRDLSELMPPYHEWIERPGDYCTITCLYSVLKLSGNHVTGHILPDVDSISSVDTLTWKDFQKDLYQVLKSNNQKTDEQ